MGKYSVPCNESVQGQCGKDDNQDMEGYKNKSRANKEENSDRLRNERFLRPGSSGVRGGRCAGSGLGAREIGRSPRRDESADEKDHILLNKSRTVMGSLETIIQCNTQGI